jgi:hypothetical protein
MFFPRPRRTAHPLNSGVGNYPPWGVARDPA